MPAQITEACVPLTFIWRELTWHVQLHLSSGYYGKWRLTEIDIIEVRDGDNPADPDHIATLSNTPDFTEVLRRISFPVLEPQG